MIILDLDDNDNLVVEISGNNFYETLDEIKQIPGASYDSETKLWQLPRTINMINNLEDKFMVAMKKNRFQLSGEQEPYVKTGADSFLDDHKTVSKYMKKFNISDMYEKLYDFQKLGAATSLYHMEKSGGFLLSDDMGLGKTIQALATIYALKSIGEVDKTIVSCPKNVKYQWAHEIEDFTDMKPIVIDGYNKEKRLECFDEEADVYIINHDQLILEDDFEKLDQLNADMIIADEVHKFKNRETLRTKAIKKLTKNFKYRLGLSGTPLQNKPSDTYSIFEFLIPDLLREHSSFTKYYIVWTYYNGRSYPAGFRNLFELKKKISSKMLRRLAVDVSDELPVVHHKNHIVPMDITQIRLHEEIEEIIENKKDEIDKERKLGNDKDADDMDDSIMGLMSLQMEVADDPRLLAMSDQEWVQNLLQTGYDGRSSKVIHAMKLVSKILKYNKDFKVVIFTRFARFVELLAQEMEEINSIDEVAVIYGDLNEKQRDEQIQKFVKSDDCRLIISSDAGCTGINLQVASHLVNIDLPWTPATLDQRNGRIRRIGSPWNEVYISNFLSENSIDLRIWDIISKKRELFDRLIENTDSQTKALKQFLKDIV